MSKTRHVQDALEETCRGNVALVSGGIPVGSFLLIPCDMRDVFVSL